MSNRPTVDVAIPPPNPLKSHPQAPDPEGSSFTKNAKLWIGQPVVSSFAAGGVAGAVSRTVVSPLERLKILYQVQDVGRNDYKLSISKALRKIWVEEGIRGMFAGNGINCLRIVPYSAVRQLRSHSYFTADITDRSNSEGLLFVDLQPLNEKLTSLQLQLLQTLL